MDIECKTDLISSTTVNIIIAIAFVLGYVVVSLCKQKKPEYNNCSLENNLKMYGVKNKITEVRNNTNTNNQIED